VSRKSSGPTRREFVKRGAVLVGGTAIAPAYAGSAWARRLGTEADTIKIGFVSPITGATSGFGEPDPYAISLAKRSSGSTGPRR
jgi:branched-chain amino acid transport system substrate-binding protein